MQEAMRRWGEADIFSNPMPVKAEPKAEFGGPVHQQLVKRREEKLARRARREQQRISGNR